jgi:hypothetical protein
MSIQWHDAARGTQYTACETSSSVPVQARLLRGPCTPKKAGGRTSLPPCRRPHCRWTSLPPQLIQSGPAGRVAAGVALDGEIRSVKVKVKRLEAAI